MVPAIIALIVFAFHTDEKPQSSQYGYRSWLPNQITLNEFLIQLLVQSILICGIYGITMFSSLSDIEIWNGRVTAKKMERVHCRHGYPCRPYPCMCGKKGCSTCWHVCYVHGYDQDWNVYNNIGESFSIDHVDSQGLKEPLDWTKVVIGEATASRHSYTNYIKYSSNSLFKKGDYGTKHTFAGYPMFIRNYFKLDRLVDPDKVATDPDQWNIDISSVAADVGKTKQANVIVYLARNKPADFFNGLEFTWFGAKKNDVVAVINVDDKNNITWVDVMGLVKDELFKVMLRDDIMDIKTLDRSKIMAVIRNDIEHFYERRPMADFKYLLYTTKISTGWFIFAFILSVIVSLGLSWYMHENDVA
jgi:hypothetical protein